MLSHRFGMRFSSSAFTSGWSKDNERKRSVLVKLKLNVNVVSLQYNIQQKKSSNLNSPSEVYRFHWLPPQIKCNNKDMFIKAKNRCVCVCVTVPPLRDPELCGVGISHVPHAALLQLCTLQCAFSKKHIRIRSIPLAPRAKAICAHGIPCDMRRRCADPTHDSGNAWPAT